jgi:hypothetical protein
MLPWKDVGVAMPTVQPPLQIPIAPPLVWMPLGESDLATRNARPASTPNVIVDNCNESIANVFCYGALTNRHSGVVYNNLMGDFPFILFDKSICYLIMYMYEPNVILATPIAGLDNTSIYNAYKSNFEELASKGFKPKLNVMDNQAIKHIKQTSPKKSVNCS